jgi:hypothetical protein
MVQTMKSKSEPTNTKPVKAPEECIFSDDGVDLTLIRWMLSLTPLERLQALQNNVNSILRLRNATPESLAHSDPKDHW